MKNRKSFLISIVIVLVILALSPFLRELLIIKPWEKLVGAPALSGVLNDGGVSFKANSTQLGSPIAIEALCTGFNDDRDYLYNLDTHIFTRNDGKQSFDLKRRSDGKILRESYPGEKFFEDQSGGVLNISYNIRPSCGGVDVIYTISNSTSQQQLLPNFKIEGVKQTKTNAKYLQTKEWGGLADALGTGPYYQIPYPIDVTYSPVMVGVNDDVSIGSSFNYPYLQYKHSITPYLWWYNDSEVKHVYNLQWPSSMFGGQQAFIPAGSQRTYTISLRVAPKEKWILTLFPYKQYFNSLYGSLKQNHVKDLRPVKGDIVAHTGNQSSSNPRGYVARSYNNQAPQRLDVTGWGSEVTWILNLMQDLGYRRFMLWTPTGVYGQNSSCVNCDFPAQFISNWTGNLQSSISELQRINNAGIPLGLWWGHAGSIPVPDTWPPASLVKANLSNPSHLAFLDNELLKAKELGVKVIGLDAIPEMLVIDRWNWIDRIKQAIPGVQILHENGGPDLLHAKVDNFYSDSYNPSSPSMGTIGGPHILSRYLNPQSEIWVAVSTVTPGSGVSGILARGQQLKKWGYTYVDWGGANANQINSTQLNQCLDGLDNDLDGKLDWPYDSGCVDESGDNEDQVQTGGPTQPNGGGSTGGGGGGSGSSGGSGSGGTTTSQEELLRRIEELMVIVRMLQEQLAAQSANYKFNTNLSLGRSGIEVSRLQTYLVARGYLVMPAGTTYGYFGNLTKSALIKFQRANNISPASGFFGPLTRAFINK